MIELVASDKPSEVLKPADGAFDLPSVSITAELSAVLGRLFYSVLFMWSDKIDTTFL